MIDIQSTIQAAIELEQGSQAPSVKFALWIAALSTQQTLEKNGKLARLLALYVTQPLPEREALYQYLKQAKAVLYTVHLDSLYYIEYLEKTGQLDGLERIGSGYLDQCRWRDRVYKLTHGHGLGWKTISFAALILEPSKSELVPVDRHVLRRLGYNTDNSPQTKRAYIAVEQQVIDERDTAGCSTIPLGIFHWYKWEEYRAVKSVGYRGNGDIETHAPLSCRAY